MSAKTSFRKFVSMFFIVSLFLSNLQVPPATALGSDGLKRQVNSQNGKVSFIGPQSGQALPAARALGTFIRPQDPAMALAKRFGPEFGLSHPERDLKEIKQNSSRDGRVTARYQQTYQGIPVMGGELIVNTNEQGDLYSMSGEVSPGPALQTQPEIDSAQAAQTALQALAKWYGKIPADFNVSEPELWIFDESLLKPSTRPVELVWRMEVTPRELGMPLRELVLVNAERGNISLHFNQVDTAWTRAKASGPEQVLDPTVLSSSNPKISENPTTVPFTTEHMPTLSGGSTWYVATTGSDANDCATTSTPCLKIQTAIDKASNGDVIEVAAGKYTGTGSRVITIGTTLSLSGGWNSSFTTRTGASTIDGQNSRQGMLTYGGGTVSATMERFAIINGDAGLGGEGGGIYNGSILNLNNVTLSNNIVTYGYGGGIYNSSAGTLTLNNVTLSNNNAGFGGGIYNYSGTLTLKNTLIGGNSASGNGIVSGPDCFGAINASDHSLISNVTDCNMPSGQGNIINVTALLGTFNSVQGYYPLLPGSPAINNGNPATCLATDQRGVSRPQGSACDIGAFEYRGGGVTPAYIITYAGTPQYIVKGTAASSPLKAVVIDADGDTVPGATVTFTTPPSGASGVFATTSANTATVITDLNGIATAPLFSANSIAGSYIIQAITPDVVDSADFQITNGSAHVQTYTANSTTSLPGTLLCNQTNPNCTSGVNPHADAAHKYSMGTYDLYAANHFRDSLDNAGMTIISTVHYDTGYSNAFWDGTQAVYGDAGGWPLADDVVAHELTHGVTERESNLFYFYQSGAINESFSDLWGEFYDQTNGQGTDTAPVKWLVSEDIAAGGTGAIRSMSNPPAYGDPDRMSSGNYYMGDGDSGGVHSNSGINNKAVSLMVDGGTFNGKTVTALGWDKTAAIYYEVNTNLLSSGSDYSDLYYALHEACKDLVGQFGITTGNCDQVKNAVDAVEMNGQPPVAGFHPDAPVCAAGQSPTNLFQDNLESGTVNWDILGSGQWSREDWYATSPTHMMWGDDYLGSSDSQLTMKNGVYLSPGTTPLLHFRHAFLFEYMGSTYYDGGVLEYSTNNGATWWDAAPLFLDGKSYPAILNDVPGSSNALWGRWAFAGDSHGYVSSRYNLSSLVGQTVKFRWRFGTDQYFGFQGWVLDDVKIYTCAADATAPTVVSITHPASSNPNLLTTDFLVTFSESVTGVSKNDFTLATTGVTGASVMSVSGSGTAYTVTVHTGAGNGTLRLNAVDNDSIKDGAGNFLGGSGTGNGNFTGGEVYITNKTVEVFIAGTVRGAYYLTSGSSQRDTYPLDAGPVKVASTNAVPFIAALRDAYLVGGQVESFAQLMGLPREQLSDTYYFPAYNNVTLDGQLRFGNVDTIPTDVTVTIGGIPRGTYTLQPNESKRVNYPLDTGPVVIKSSNGASIIAALRDAYLAGGQVESFVQLMGLPKEQLSDTYYFPAYNNVTLDGQLRFGNVDTITTDVTVTIGGVDRGTYTLQPNQSQRVSFPLDTGPVVIKSSNGAKIIAALRDAYLVNGKVESFAQLMGLPLQALSDTYYFPAYNNVTLDGQLRFGNVDTIATDVTVTIGGVSRGTYTLQPNQSHRGSFPLDTGPVVIKSSNGAKIIAALRDAYLVNNQVVSFVQLMGLPFEALSDTYYFPAYNNVTLSGQLRFGVP